MDSPPRIPALIGVGLRAIAASTPYAGAIAQLWSEYQSRRLQRRIDSFFSDLAGQLKVHEQRLAAVEAYLQTSDEVPALLEKCVYMAATEPSAMKRAIVASAFVNLLESGANMPYDSKYELLASLETLTETDLFILRAFGSMDSCRVRELPARLKELEVPHPPDQEGLIMSLSKLTSRGLLGQSLNETDVNESAFWPQPETALESWQRRRLTILPVGRRLLGVLDY